MFYVEQFSPPGCPLCPGAIVHTSIQLQSNSCRDSLPWLYSSTSIFRKADCRRGLDGSGKSTQIYLVKRWLELEGYRVFFTEWNSSVLVKKSTSKGKKRQLLTPTTFSLIHATDFADRYERQILPLLRAGYIVLADRYIYHRLGARCRARRGPRMGIEAL